MKTCLHFEQINSFWNSSILTAVVRTTVPTTHSNRPTSLVRGTAWRYSSGQVGTPSGVTNQWVYVLCYIIMEKKDVQDMFLLGLVYQVEVTVSWWTYCTVMWIGVPVMRAWRFSLSVALWDSPPRVSSSVRAAQSSDESSTGRSFPGDVRRLSATSTCSSNIVRKLKHDNSYM